MSLIWGRSSRAPLSGPAIPGRVWQGRISDPLAAFRGMMIGCAIGAILWGCIGLTIWMVR